ncbi:hypothetical protein BCR34DRAFT_631853 [Clohesyomyces aquaticus]|uniref:Uncharacterized protein n=1 Tax=Clohesyomyces aquaticus TaxID=1231657 RepID=A0A1Y1ZA38_9PLEO|nr:hypothetical protein BCR34DRAFT_631853 [Clohesyomyces aquaticus]
MFHSHARLRQSVRIEIPVLESSLLFTTGGEVPSQKLVTFVSEGIEQTHAYRGAIEHPSIALSVSCLMSMGDTSCEGFDATCENFYGKVMRHDHENNLRGLKGRNGMVRAHPRFRLVASSFSAPTDTAPSIIILFVALPASSTVLLASPSMPPSGAHKEVYGTIRTHSRALDPFRDHWALRSSDQSTLFAHRRNTAQIRPHEPLPTYHDT